MESENRPLVSYLLFWDGDGNECNQTSISLFNVAKEIRNKIYDRLKLRDQAGIVAPLFLKDTYY